MALSEISTKLNPNFFWIGIKFVCRCFFLVFWQIRKMWNWEFKIRENMRWTAKGQLILKSSFGVSKYLNLPKNQRKNCVGFLEDLKTPKGYFRINWPLGHKEGYFFWKVCTLKYLKSEQSFESILNPWIFAVQTLNMIDLLLKTNEISLHNTSSKNVN